ncbi:peptidase domain-containing ABC transporter [Pleurocapsales cyanobacterium LEGE 06147]|nr:peptidase domain-containing ABC transporter [Pleurocapsales cyanobacterium LEGE 06147]
MPEEIKEQLASPLPDRGNLIFRLLKKQLEQEGINSKLIASLSSIFEIKDFQLGDLLLDRSPTESISRKQNTQHFYIICQGRVRLLSFDPVKRRQVPAGLLCEGDTFGDDSLFCSEYLPYRAIAANEVKVARISLEQLQPWLEQLPKLKNKWGAAAQQRQALIFFKTLTVLRALSSHKLQQLLPYIKKRKIEAGATLARVTSSEAGRFWLRRGQIQNELLDVGSSWGYPEDIPADWIAQSNLLVYELPKQYWQAALAIAPNLAETFGISSSSSLQSKNGFKPVIVSQGKGAVALPSVTNPDLGNDSSSISPTSNSEAISTQTPTPSPPNSPKTQTEVKVEFPKPKKYRRGLLSGYPFIEQQSASDCGAACLAMISQYWGKRFGINWLRELAGVGRSGASLKGLAKAAESLGFKARPVRASLSSLEGQKNPWIAHWKGDHYVVVYQIKGDRVLIADPALGKKSLTRQQFLLDGWTGYALLLEPTELLAATPNQKRSLGRYFKLLLPYRSLAVQIILASLLIQVFGLVTPLFTQIILDQVVVNRSLPTLHVFAFGVLLFGVWNIGLSAIRQYLLSYLSNHLDLTMIGGFIRHTLMLPLKFFEMRHVGDIITRVQENQKIQRFLLAQVVLAWLDFLMGFVYLALMFYYNWQLTLLIVGLIPFIIIVTLGATPLLRQVSRDVFNRSAEQNSALVETISGIDTIKATAAERELRWRWEERLTSFLNVRFRGQKLGIGLQAATGLINTLGSTALLWYGATLVIQDQLTIGQFVAFNMLIARVLEPVLSLSNLWDELQEVLVSVEKLNDVFTEAPEETPDKSMLVLPRVRGEIKFENVTFCYGEEDDRERNTLQNISFEAKAGQTIAIVGRSGSGKTTLIKLLEGLYKPNRGQIWIDGHEIRHISPQSLRSQIGVVPQECFLFSGTILENITLYRQEYTLEQAIEAAKLAEAHAFIQGMPLGYNTKVGERGANLSGGQRQRIAIARALLGKPRILILDEATSSLDTESEQRFQQNLARLAGERTTFIIAHRLSTVRSADLILVIDRGVIVERGTHKELIANRQGLYYYLAQQQLAL